MPKLGARDISAGIIRFRGDPFIAGGTRKDSTSSPDALQDESKKQDLPQSQEARKVMKGRRMESGAMGNAGGGCLRGLLGAVWFWLHGVKLLFLLGAPIVPWHQHTAPSHRLCLLVGAGTQLNDTMRLLSIRMSPPAVVPSLIKFVEPQAIHREKTSFPSVIRGKFGCQGAQILITKLPFLVAFYHEFLASLLC